MSAFMIPIPGIMMTTHAAGRQRQTMGSSIPLTKEKGKRRRWCTASYVVSSILFLSLAIGVSVWIVAHQSFKALSTALKSGGSVGGDARYCDTPLATENRVQSE